MLHNTENNQGSQCCTGSLFCTGSLAAHGSGGRSRVGAVKLYLFDGTYELFRACFGAPPRSAPDGREVGVADRAEADVVGIDRRTYHVAVTVDRVDAVDERNAAT